MTSDFCSFCWGRFLALLSVDPYVNSFLSFSFFLVLLRYYYIRLVSWVDGEPVSFTINSITIVLPDAKIGGEDR